MAPVASSARSDLTDISDTSQVAAAALPSEHAGATLRPPLSFVLPAELEATEPVEVRTGRRDSVRMLVSRGGRPPTHERFTDLPALLEPGDLLVVNTSRTMPAAISGTLVPPGTWPHVRPVEVHLSTELPTGLWLVEVRTPGRPASSPMTDDITGSRIELDGGASVDLLARFTGSNRLWVSSLHLPAGLGLVDHLAVHGRPIRYHYVPRDWPIDAYDTVFAIVPGSAEMPSASRPFTTELVTDLVVAGIGISPVLLHTGVSSAESHEPPFPERFSVPRVTADRANATRAAGGRVVAVGTTVVRALESAVDDRGVVHPASGWADVVVTPERGVRAVDGLVTGWHEPEASHLLMLEAVAGRPALASAYDAAIAERYLWHEFGDVHLILRDHTSP
jgi:S-adenosylmethionine:tRNA ribosyltransferase-isomerase